MTTAGNLSIEIRYQKLKVNFNYCFRHGIFQNQVYNFFDIISWVVSYCSFIVRFVCFSSQNFLSFECLWKIRFLLYRFCKSNCMSLRNPHSTNLNRRCHICGNLLGKKTWSKEKYITQLNSVLFIKITKDLQYCILPRYGWNAAFLWIRPPKEIYSTVFHLKLVSLW